MNAALLRKLRKKLGADRVLDDAPAVYASDKWFAKGTPAAVVFPANTEETSSTNNLPLSFIYTTNCYITWGT